MSSLVLTPTSCATDGLRDKTPVNSPQALPQPSAPQPAMASNSMGTSSEEPIRILLLWTLQAGKSSFRHDAMYFSTGKTSSSSRRNTHTIIPSSYATKINGKIVHLIDTPGFGDYDADNARILGMIGDYLNNNGGIKLNGVIFLLPIDEKFTDYKANIFETLIQDVDPHNADQILVVTTK
ncbi:hypothetical protein H072_3743 [Dactylellina haptotyla CBS 200.50]|uniref:G domain-containing protein n=1 Tax=Dactylellina haptotyla (strain CBS 200.50) TaxID=1284197 RepID=S8AGW3_DACHA|nr:hypothetical protein H072_3743 [Dactylellina haptotyla CBS 200.50]